MDIFKKRGFQVFLLGALLTAFFLPNFIIEILAFPVVWIGLLVGSGILGEACKFSEDPRWCSAGVLDGGPNDWFIELSIYISSALFYGFIFWLVYRIYRYFKNKKQKTNKKPE